MAQNMIKNRRLLTVSSKNLKRKYDNVNVPYLRLAGKWLSAAGIKIGDLAEVEIVDNCIVIKKSKLRWQEEVTVKRWLVNDAGVPINIK